MPWSEDACRVTLEVLSAAFRMNSLCQQCIETLRTMRMPTNRNESYRFTDVAPIMAQSFEVRHNPWPAAMSCNMKRRPSASSILMYFGASTVLTGLQLRQCTVAITLMLICLRQASQRSDMSVHLSLLQIPDGTGAKDTVIQHPLEESSTSQLVIIDGVPSLELSNLSSMPDDVYVGGVQHAPSQVVSQQLVSQQILLQTLTQAA